MHYAFFRNEISLLCINFSRILDNSDKMDIRL